MIVATQSTVYDAGTMLSQQHLKGSAMGGQKAAGRRALAVAGVPTVFMTQLLPPSHRLGENCPGGLTSAPH